MSRNALVVAMLLHETDMPRMEADGTVLHSVCIVCRRPVCAHESAIDRVIADNHVPMPICRPCVTSPEFRKRVAGAKIEHGPGVTKAEVREFAAILKSPGDGTGIN